MMLAYVYTHHMGWGWGIFMMLGLLALLTLLAFVLIAAVRDRHDPSPCEVLDHRIAAGEIDEDEYRRARDAMTGGDAGLPPANPPAPA